MEVLELIYTCDSCGSLFMQPSEPEQCPGCGKDTIRPASEVEQEEYTARMFGRLEDESSSPFPDLVEIGIERIDGFTFKLPATALQIDSKMILEIVVECGMSPTNQNMIAANVWVRPVDGTLSGFLTSIQVQSIPNESLWNRAERMIAALNEDTSFLDLLYQFVTMLIRSGH